MIEKRATEKEYLAKVSHVVARFDTTLSANLFPVV